MSAWPSVDLKDCVRVVGGATPKTGTPAYWDGDVPWTTPKDLTNLEGKFLEATPRMITQTGLKSCAAELLPPNSVLFSSRAPIGHVAINSVPMATNQGFKSMVPGPDIDASYLYWWLRCHRAQLEMLGNGATFKEVSKTVVERVQIPLPPLDEQKRIAAILDQADELRRKRQRAIDRLNQLGQAIFHDMFGDPLGAKKLSDGWTVEPIEANIDFMDYRGKTPLKSPTGVRLITAKNVKMGFINIEPQEFVEEESYDSWMTRGFPEYGDVLFTTEAPLGHVAQLDTDEKVVIGQRLITMKPNQSLIRSSYLEFYLRSPGFRRKMFENSTGSTVVGIKSKLLKKIEICYPSIEHQLRFEKTISELASLKPRFEKKLVRVESLFASLQHSAFQGEL